MDPITWVTALNVLRKYWWVLVLIAVAVYIMILRGEVSSRDKIIEQQKQTIAIKESEIKDSKIKIDTQNKAVEDMAQKGKEQTSKLNDAITRVNAMKPATQVIIREIYTDKSKDANQLLLNALND